MGEYLDQIPEEIRGHIREITKLSGLSEGEDSVEMIAQAWLEKKKTFEEETQKLNMEELPSFGKEDERAAIALTYSGSLVNIGPLKEDLRKVQYMSIGLRQDVPAMAERDSRCWA